MERLGEEEADAGGRYGAHHERVAKHAQVFDVCLVPNVSARFSEDLCHRRLSAVLAGKLTAYDAGLEVGASGGGGARWFRDKGIGALIKSLQLFEAALRIGGFSPVLIPHSASLRLGGPFGPPLPMLTP